MLVLSPNINRRTTMLLNRFMFAKNELIVDYKDEINFQSYNNTIIYRYCNVNNQLINIEIYFLKEWKIVIEEYTRIYLKKDELLKREEKSFKNFQQLMKILKK